MIISVKTQMHQREGGGGQAKGRQGLQTTRRIHFPCFIALFSREDLQWTPSRLAKPAEVL